jgi:secondary thiamine-phosphate synthase enzyme
MIHTLNIQTREHDQMIHITGEINALIEKEKISDGVAVVYCPHTTAGITINENADPDVQHDVLMRLNEIYPWEHPKHRHNEGNSASHLKAITTGNSQTLFIKNGRLMLGRWQGVFFCEFDGPRQRNYMVKLMY